MRVDAGTYKSSTHRILTWARTGEPRYVCVSNVHMVMETRDSASFREVVNRSDLVTSDGMPLVWILRARGHREASRVYGPTLMLHVCEAAADNGIPIALFGGTPDVLQRLEANLTGRFPNLKIATRIAPPFGTFSAEQNENFIGEINRSGAKIVFVGLGCPKQERWMAARTGSIPAVLIGVGAAFNFHAGMVKQAPAWLQNLGLEWAFRLVMEPKRLWKRYLWHNPRFVWTVAKEEVRRLFGLFVDG